MLIGRKEDFLRKGYNYDLGATVVERKLNGVIRADVVIASGPIIYGKGKSFEELCNEYNVEEIRVRNLQTDKWERRPYERER